MQCPVQGICTISTDGHYNYANASSIESSTINASMSRQLIVTATGFQELFYTSIYCPTSTQNDSCSIIVDGRNGTSDAMKGLSIYNMDSFNNLNLQCINAPCFGVGAST